MGAIDSRLALWHVADACLLDVIVRRVVWRLETGAGNNAQFIPDWSRINNSRNSANAMADYMMTGGYFAAGGVAAYGALAGAAMISSMGFGLVVFIWLLLRMLKSAPDRSP